MSYSSRVYRQRNPRAKEEAKEESFFSKQHDAKKGSRKGGFFQAKLAVNEPGDTYEQEADAVANTVVNKANGKKAVQQKEISSVQRLSTPAEDEKVGTNDARMKKDKDIQEKAIQKMGEPDKEKKDVQKMDEPKKEEKKEVQKKEEPKKEEEKVQKKEEPKKEEDKPVQKMDEPKKEEKKEVQKKAEPMKEEKKEVQKKEEPKKEEEKKTAVQTKHESGSGTSDAVSAGIERSAGKGKMLPPAALNEMNRGFGVDFSGVRIHNDNESVHLSSDLEAQAFTHGKDIYFNEGKFDPASKDGKTLLAHELTHVVQQKGSELRPAIRQQPTAAQPATQHVANISTPVPGSVQPTPAGNVEMDINGVKVVILTDVHSRRRGHRAETRFSQSGGLVSNVVTRKGHVVSFSGPSQVNVVIRTTYQRQAQAGDPSTYGRGTTTTDQASGDTSLGFHEGNHGTDYINFLQTSPLPVFSGTAGMSSREFRRALRQFNRAMTKYFRDMARTSVLNTDCVGTTIYQLNGSNVCVP